jgi:hypothetical protein
LQEGKHLIAYVNGNKGNQHIFKANADLASQAFQCMRTPGGRYHFRF